MPTATTNEDKARSVLSRTGNPIGVIASLSPADLEQLAAIYDECCAPELQLAERMRAFWDTRADELAKQKAAADPAPVKASPASTRSKKSPTPVPAAQAPETAAPVVAEDPAQAASPAAAAEPAAEPAAKAQPAPK